MVIGVENTNGTPLNSAYVINNICSLILKSALMVISTASANLESIRLEDIDFTTVQKCTDGLVLEKYAKLIEDDGGYFKELLDACKQKMKEVDPARFRRRYETGQPAKYEDVNL